MSTYVVYSINNCKFCEFAKRDLRAKNRGFTDINVETNRGTGRMIMERTGQNTWPQIFYRGDFIGGYRELRKLLE